MPQRLPGTTVGSASKSIAGTGTAVDRKRTVWILGAAAFAISASLMLLHRPWTRTEGGDEAIWDYVAQCILRGQVPYRDVVEIKAPLSAYLGAAAMFIGKSAGVRDIIAVRMLNVLMAGVLSAVTFVVGATYLRSRLAAVLGFLIALAPSHFAEWIGAGTEPKLPMILFGMISLLLVARHKPFLAGFFSMLSCLCWQPGLLFSGVVLLIFSRYLTSWRDPAVMKAALGALVPLTVTVLYFLLAGALSDLWKWTIAYNFRVYAPETMRSLRDTIVLLWRVSFRVFKFNLVFVALAFVGFIIFAIERVRAGYRSGFFSRESDLFRDALLISPLIYLGFCLVNFQSGPDLIPLFPFIGLFAGWCLVNAGGKRMWLGFPRPLPVLALIALTALIVSRAVTYRVDSGLTLQDQDKQVAAIGALLGPEDRFYVHGAVEIPVLLNKPNLNPYIYLDRGKDDWVARRMPDGFRAVIGEMETQAPKVVVISRIGKMAHRTELEQWVEEHYVKIGLAGLDGVYLRKQK